MNFLLVSGMPRRARYETVRLRQCLFSSVGCPQLLSTKLPRLFRSSDFLQTAWAHELTRKEDIWTQPRGGSKVALLHACALSMAGSRAARVLQPLQPRLCLLEASTGGQRALLGATWPQDLTPRHWPDLHASLARSWTKES